MQPTLYIETSAILTWLLGESDSQRVIRLIDETETIVSSVLSILETERALLRYENQGHIRSADCQKLRGLFLKVSQSWSFIEITPHILERAACAFPVEPIRSLDAIHLASAIEFLLIHPELKVASFDHRIVDNLVPLGMDNAFNT